jgi:hypothetical protein
VLDGAGEPASSWRRARDGGLVEAAVTQGARYWEWHDTRVPRRPRPRPVAEAAAQPPPEPEPVLRLGGEPPALDEDPDDVEPVRC